MHKLTRTAAVAALSIALPLPACGVVTAAQTPPASVRQVQQNPLFLPEPTGRATIGRDTLHLVDHSRRDPWVPNRPRELMVSLYYPAAHASAPTVPYLSAHEADLLLTGLHRDGQIDPKTMAATRTNAHPHAAPTPGRHPLVVLSPGFTANRATLSLLAEELTSRGYLVALVDHAYETYGTDFPGGRTLTCRACDQVESGRDHARGDSDEAFARVADNRARDVSFLLDRLTARNSRYTNLIDPHRIGMAGHSVGGNAAARAMATDPRVRAGADLDGTFFAPIPANGLDHRPFLLLGAENLHTPTGEDDTWPRDYRRLNGWKRWLTVSGAGHFSFTDLPVLAAELGLPEDPGLPLPGDRSGEITRDYVAAFFDLHLRGIQQPLLNGPTETNPEVTFHHP